MDHWLYDSKFFSDSPIGKDNSSATFVNWSITIDASDCIYFSAICSFLLRLHLEGLKF